eukprot:TRINITY_DN36124_c0_g1_i2.p1 TRINITY_DN36124_c0_g1~~TRINITY_DN36124_c0_g1_i2.p1  ORF type:complete len:133 (+),score=30.83 TRINITY_DN36124_c0_g1_i2:27-401(+)
MITYRYAALSQRASAMSEERERQDILADVYGDGSPDGADDDPADNDPSLSSAWETVRRAAEADSDEESSRAVPPKLYPLGGFEDDDVVTGFKDVAAKRGATGPSATKLGAQSATSSTVLDLDLF